jgi:hypothetical protein
MHLERERERERLARKRDLIYTKRDLIYRQDTVKINLMLEKRSHMEARYCQKRPSIQAR